jgi:K+-transporting ATPase ATPase A chain
MKANELIQLVVYFGLLIGLTPLLGRFMARVFRGERTFLSGSSQVKREMDSYE